MTGTPVTLGLGTGPTGAAAGARPAGAGPAGARRQVLARRVRWLVAATITYNVVEAVVALAEGTRVSSAALVGFGIDSAIEVASAAAVAWQFSGSDPARHEQREHRALRAIALSFFALALFVTVDSLRLLLTGQAAQHSTVGLVLAALSLVVMPALSTAQRRTGRALGSRSAVADSHQTMLCTYLSAVLLVGLALNSGLGWSWADPAAALVIAAVAVREGLQAWRGDACCAPGAPVAPAAGEPAAGEPVGCACCGPVTAAAAPAGGGRS